MRCGGVGGGATGTKRRFAFLVLVRPDLLVPLPIALRAAFCASEKGPAVPNAAILNLLNSASNLPLSTLSGFLTRLVVRTLDAPVSCIDTPQLGQLIVLFCLGRRLFLGGMQLL